MKNDLSKNMLYENIAVLLQAARQNVVRTVNQTMVYTYYEIGRMIVEEEQQGAVRAEYSKQTLKELSKRLSFDFGRGFSERNLEQMRQFYLVYSISQKSSAELKYPQLQLSWSHYLKLMRIENTNERNFYEIECAINNWSLKELQRQFDAALYENCQKKIKPSVLSFVKIKTKLLLKLLCPKIMTASLPVVIKPFYLINKHLLNF